MKLFKSDEFGHFVPTQGIIVLRGILEFWIPDHCARHLKYDKKHVPVSQYRAVIQSMRVDIWLWQDGQWWLEQSYYWRVTCV